MEEDKQNDDQNNYQDDQYKQTIFQNNQSLPLIPQYNLKIIQKQNSGLVQQQKLKKDPRPIAEDSNDYEQDIQLDNAPLQNMSTIEAINKQPQLQELQSVTEIEDDDDNILQYISDCEETDDQDLNNDQQQYPPTAFTFSNVDRHDQFDEYDEQDNKDNKDQRKQIDFQNLKSLATEARFTPIKISNQPSQRLFDDLQSEQQLEEYILQLSKKLKAEQKYQGEEHLLPTKATILALKARKISYVKGHDLLKKKADSLQARYRELKLKIDEKQATTMQQLRQAYFQLIVTKKNVNQDLFTLAQSTLSFSPRSTIHQTVSSVGGVKLPDLQIQIVDTQLFQNNISYEVLSKSQKMWEEVVTNLVELAAMKASYNTLAEVILQTNRRVNALEYKLLPEIDQNIAYINDVLDEEERSNLFVMKMVKNMIQEQADLEDQKLKEAVGEQTYLELKKENEKAKTGIIQGQQDEDLVF